MLREQDSQDVPRLSTRHMLAEEISYVRGTPSPCPENVYDWAREKNLTALCLSGGGIRSASFCLGVIQALARKGLLRQFDYLSTVSGGGYIGGWLQQLIREARHQPDPKPEDQPDPKPEAERVRAAEAVLRKHEPPALDRLRDNTNFLTPRGGVGSPDIWASVALYLRNLMHNWLVLGPVFLLAALLPILHRTTIWWVGQFDLGAVVAMAVAALALGQSVYLVCRWVPSHCTDAMRETLEVDSGLTRDARKKLRWLQFRIVGGALAWALLLPVGLQFLLGHGWSRWFVGGAGSWGLWLLPLAHVLTMLAAYCLAWAVARIAAWRTGRPEQEDRGWRLYGPNFIRWVVASVGTGMVYLVAMRLLWAGREWLVIKDSVADALTLGAPLVLLGTLLSQSTFYLGLRRRAVFADLDREWLARMNGIILGIGVGWTLFATACLLIPKLTLAVGQAQTPESYSEAAKIGANALGTLLSGFAASWLGKLVIGQVQSVAGSKPPGQMLALALKVLPVVFVVLLFGFMGAVLQLSLGRLQKWSVPLQDWLMPSVKPTCNVVEMLGDFDLFVSGLLCTALPPYFTAPGWSVVFQLGALVVVLLPLWMSNKFTNVNRFSLHALYRNRLTRAFLGTPRERRRPDPFTGFDNDDDPRLKDFRDDLCPGQRLFPVINMTLNMTTGTRTAWAERQGASFTATPLHCGSADISATRNLSAKPGGAYVATERFGGQENSHDTDGKNKGTRLGSMMTISGAAASPHMGYNSSPAIAFLMALFNVRLGAWYPNPAVAPDAALRLAKPESSLWALLGELTGSARADTQAIYLSDGGHFDNLGVYEMIRRRCKRILVIDAGQDGKYTFFDLGMMIRKAEIDFPVRITIDPEIIPTREALKKDSALRQKTTGFARGTIEYLDENGAPNDTGVIIYVKPCLLADAPAGVKSYAADNPEFPHESTNDQWFSESQFESYRTLGVCQGLHLLKGVGKGDMDVLFGTTELSVNPG